MATLDDHPTVKTVRARGPAVAAPRVLDAAWLRALCLEAGADDAGFVAIDRPELDDQRGEILAAFPATKALVSLVGKLNPEPIRSPMRSAGNLEFHANYEEINGVARAVVTRLGRAGVAAMNPSSGFPMEMDRFPGRIWVVSHKPVAVAAGLGRIGIHRNVIHPKFGNFISLATVLVAAEVSEQGAAIDYNPCLSCKLCVAACPVGAIGADGHFDFSACATHNYREFLNGFTGWVETIADSRDARDYRSRVTDSESASMWQSLGFGPNYKAAYCIAACPAGEDVIGPFLDDRGGFVRDVVKPLQAKAEPVYVVAGSDAEAYVGGRFPHKTPRRVGGLRASTIRGFLEGLPLLFQRGRASGMDATYHFTFTGAEPAVATVSIRDGTVRVSDGHEGKPDLRVTADSRAWLAFVRKDRGILGLLLFRKIRVTGPLKLLKAFGRCFPS